MAAATWAAVALALEFGPSTASVLVAVAAFGTAVGRGLVRSGLTAMVAACLLTASCGIAAVAVRERALHTDPLAVLARAGAPVVVTLSVDGLPRRRSTTGAGPPGDQVVLLATVRSLRRGSGDIALRSPVVVLAGGSAWSRLVPSQHLRAAGRVAVAQRGPAVALLAARGPPRSVTAPSSVQAAAAAVRSSLRDALAGLPADEAGLMPGLVVGDTSGMPDGLRQDFTATGMTHLVAVSGANVAVVVGMLLGAGRLLGLGLRARALVAVVGLVAFVVGVGPSASVVRATGMGLIGIVAVVTGRRAEALPALAATVFALVLLDPWLSVDAGFALSVAATTGLVVIAPSWRSSFARRLPDWLADLSATALAAQVACGPVVVALFGTASLTSVPANLMAAPVVPVVTVLGVVAAVSGLIAPSVATALGTVAWLPLAWLVGVAGWGARAPLSTVHLPDGWSGAVLVALLSVVGWAAVRRRRWRRGLAAASTAAVVTAATLTVVAPAWPPRGWVAAFCDIGQGDAAAIRTGRHAALVIDAGPDPLQVDRCLARLGVRHVPVVLLSHLHADHVDGLPGVLRRRDVGTVLVGPLSEPAGEWSKVQRWTSAARVAVQTVGAGASGQQGGVAWRALGPLRVLHGTDSDPNNDSLVVAVEVGGLRLLFAGDVEPEGQRPLDGLGAELHADVLKVPHHGSDRQDPRFLGLVHARLAVVSVGAHNRYGHPSARTIGLLQGLGMAVVRTDRSGDVVIRVSAGRLAVTTRRGRATVGGPARDASGTLRTSTPAPATVGTASTAAASSPDGPAGVVAAVPPAPDGRVAESPLAPHAATARAPPGPGGGGGMGGPRRPGSGAGRERMAHDEPPRVTLVTGDEDLLVGRAVDRAVAAVREYARAIDGGAVNAVDNAAQDGAVDVVDVELSAADVAGLDEAISPSLFAERRVVVLRDAHLVGRPVADWLLRACERPPGDVWFVVTHSGGTKGQRLVTALTTSGAVEVPCPRLTRHRERVDFVLAEARTSGSTLTQDAAELLIDTVGTDLRGLATAVGQLVADVSGDRPGVPVNADAVRIYHTGRAEASGFAAADFAVAGDLANALSELRWMTAAGGAPVLVTAALAANLRLVAKVAAAGRGSSASLARSIGVPAWKVDKARRWLRAWEPTALADAVIAVAEADADVKGNASDPEYRVERAVTVVASLARRA